MSAENTLSILVLIDRLLSMISNLGATIREANVAGRDVSKEELDAQSKMVDDKIEAARAEIAALRLAQE